MMEFHISRNARERYQFAESLFSYTGNVVFANMAACREFAYRMNQVRDVQNHPDRAVHAGSLYAMGLIDEASHAAARVHGGFKSADNGPHGPQQRPDSGHRHRTGAHPDAPISWMATTPARLHRSE